VLDSPRSRRRALHAGVLALGVAPLAGLAIGWADDGLGANPIEKLTHETGAWALRFLMASLAITPLRRLSGWRIVLQERRTLGLLAFLYASLHLSIYAFLDQGIGSGDASPAVQWGYLVEDIAERPYITVGFATFLVLAVLAATSTRGMTRRLGRRWKPLHRIVYVAGAGAVIHFLWLVKADTREPLIYAAVLGSLLGIRAWWALRSRQQRRQAAAPTPPRSAPPARAAPPPR
jgi:sulfoxide reductase heme-binding subunit YedZ